MSQFKLFESVVCNIKYYLYKKCLKLKNVPIWSEGGVNIYKKCPNFKNVPKVGRGGGQP